MQLLPSKPYFFLIGSVLAILITCFSFKNKQTPSSNTIIEKIDENGIHGVIMSRSDIEGEADTPIRALLFAIPNISFDTYLNNLGIDTEERLRTYERLWHTASEELFNKHVSTHTWSNEKGNYRLEVEPDSYWICMGAPPATDPLSFPFTIYGCVQADMKNKSSLPFNLFWGEAGLTTE